MAAKDVYPPNKIVSYDKLKEINRRFLLALSEAYPKTAHELASRFGRLDSAPEQAVLPVIEAQIERLIDKVNKAQGAPAPYEHDGALVTARLPKRRSDTIIKECCEKYEISIQELRSKRRKKKLVHARQEVMYWLYAETSLTLPMIGKRLGGRDHTTVLHGLRQHAKRTGSPHLVKPRASS